MKNRLIFDVELRPVRGELFTPGTPASGPVKYVSGQGKNCVQVGSVQDVAVPVPSERSLRSGS